ncbi:MAG: toxin-antitoxin system HicB family antitoxin [Chloroflexota bacterium]
MFGNACERRVAPQKPFSGRLNLLFDPVLHRWVALAGASLNAWIAKVLRDVLLR